MTGKYICRPSFFLQSKGWQYNGKSCCVLCGTLSIKIWCKRILWDYNLFFSNRVNMVIGGSSRLRQKPNLPNCVMAPQAVLASKPISLNDIHLVSPGLKLTFSSKISEKRIKINCSIIQYALNILWYNSCILKYLWRGNNNL